VFDFGLSDAEVATIGGLETGTRLGPDPDNQDTRPRPGFSSAGGRWVDKTGGSERSPKPTDYRTADPE
jgi:hypothetical protein